MTSLSLAMESYEFIRSYELSSQYEESDTDVTPLELTNSCVVCIADYFRRQENLPQVYRFVLQVKSSIKLHIYITEKGDFY